MIWNQLHLKESINISDCRDPKVNFTAWRKYLMISIRKRLNQFLLTAEYRVAFENWPQATRTCESAGPKPNSELYQNRFLARGFIEVSESVQTTRRNHIILVMFFSILFSNLRNFLNQIKATLHQNYQYGAPERKTIILHPTVLTPM